MLSGIIRLGLFSGACGCHQQVKSGKWLFGTAPGSLSWHQKFESQDLGRGVRRLGPMAGLWVIVDLYAISGDFGWCQDLVRCIRMFRVL